MDTSEILGRHHRRMVDEFIESVLDELDLADLERNIVGLVIRREIEELVPGLAAIHAVFHAADSGTLGGELPEWLERLSSEMPGEAEFFKEMSRRLDPSGDDFLMDNLGGMLGKSEVRKVFEAHLWEILPCVSRSVGSVP